MTEIEKDILDWIQNYIEANHEFYNYKFPPCPYAKAARIKGLVKVKSYESGSYKKFIDECLNSIDDKTILVLAMPPKLRWYYHIHWYIRHLNKKLISKNRYMQYGTAVTTNSKYPGIKGPYFISIVNVLSDVMDGHKQLLNTDYYKFWDKKHYNDVVVRRNEMVEKYDRQNNSH